MIFFHIVARQDWEQVAPPRELRAGKPRPAWFHSLEYGSSAPTNSGSLLCRPGRPPGPADRWRASRCARAIRSRRRGRVPPPVRSAELRCGGCCAGLAEDGRSFRGAARLGGGMGCAVYGQQIVTEVAGSSVTLPVGSDGVVTLPHAPVPDFGTFPTTPLTGNVLGDAAQLVTVKLLRVPRPARGVIVHEKGDERAGQRRTARACAAVSTVADIRRDDRTRRKPGGTLGGYAGLFDAHPRLLPRPSNRLRTDMQGSAGRPWRRPRSERACW